MEAKEEELVEVVAEVAATPEVEVEKEEVAATPEEKVVEAAPEAPEADVLHEAHEVLRTWKRIYEEEKEKADDSYYYAKDLWCEDKDFWDHGKHKVHRGEWTVETFEEELEALKRKQEPVWDKLLKQVDESSAKLEKPAEDVKEMAEKVKASIGPHPVKKLIGKGPTSQEAEVRHEYHWKLQREFKDAKAQYEELCAHPEGTLTQVKLMRVNVVREDINVTEYLHGEQGGHGFKSLPVIRKIVGKG